MMNHDPKEDQMFDFNAAYKVEGYPGIAWRAYAHPIMDPECPGHPDDGIMAGPIGETFYCDGSCTEGEVDEDNVICHMVGDDRDFTFGVDQLTKLDEDAYCVVCGQIGCGHGALMVD